ncbi:hypothetical protein PI125_g10363 [Phytophthora idaei]|nr:hypothetical protein PI125_g10363 [Phytophthora idaei]
MPSLLNSQPSTLNDLPVGHEVDSVPLRRHGDSSDWMIVQIAPQFQANWESVVNDDELIALYVEKVKEAGYANNIRKRFDSDTNLYGAECGFSNPDAKPKDPPSDGTATIERGLAHHGPCEIWLDDTLALHNDDCAKAFSVKDYMSIKSVFKPVDYSSCLPSGCMFRFYWLAFQGSTSGKYVWQISELHPFVGGQTSTAGTGIAKATQTPASNSLQTDVPTAGTPTPEAKTQTMQAQWTHHPRRGMKVHPLLKPRQQTRTPPPTVTNAPVWTNVPAVESSGTVAPFTQTEMAQSPVLDTATNTPNSYSFHNAGQATRTSASGHEQMQTSMVAPALSL